MVDISIVIVNYNTGSLLDACLQSIQKETTVGYEVIVVDNASTDQSFSVVEKKYPEVQLIKNNGNMGFARANNQGFSVATGRYFFMLNPDTVILDNAIDKLVEFMDRNPDVGICGPKNVSPEGTLQYSCDHFPSLWNTFCSYTNLINRFPRIRLFTQQGMRYWDYDETRDVDKITGCSLIIRSSLFKKLCGLDEKYFMYFEETDLCYRARKAGSRIVYLHEAKIVHYGGESSKKIATEQVIDKTVFSYYQSSKYYFYRKHYGILPMAFMRSLDLIYGMALIGKNSLRRDKYERDLRVAKGQALCLSALARNMSPIVK